MRRKSLLFLLLMDFWFLVFAFSVVGSAKVYTDSICIVADEHELQMQLISGMKRHQETFCFYYPGIIDDFICYQNNSIGFYDFWEKLAMENGYEVGIISGSCITIHEQELPYVSIQIYYMVTKRQQDRINKKVRKIVRQLGRGSVAVRARKAHDYLIRHMSYDGRFYSPYDAFFRKKGLCMAYALAYQRLLQEMRIPCLYIRGTNHAWNMVKIKGRWYNVDVTYDDARGTHQYFLKSDADFPGHKRPATKYLKRLKVAKKSYRWK